MQHIKKIYLYLVSIIALVIMVVGAIMLLNMALKTWVFPKADNWGHFVYPTKIDCERMQAEQVRSKTAAGEVLPLPAECIDPSFAVEQEKRQKEDRAAQKQSDAAQALAMIIVALPVWFFHWRLARKEQ